MSLVALSQRLARVEHARAARGPIGIPRPAVLYLAPDEDAEPHLACLVDQGEHRRGWPVLAIRADWPSVRIMQEGAS